MGTDFVWNCWYIVSVTFQIELYGIFYRNYILTKSIFISTFQRDLLVQKLVVYLISIFCSWMSESRCFCCAWQKAWKVHFCSGPFGDAVAAAICSLFNLIKPGTVSRSKDLRERKKHLGHLPDEHVRRNDHTMCSKLFEMIGLTVGDCLFYNV